MDRWPDRRGARHFPACRHIRRSDTADVRWQHAGLAGGVADSSAPQMIDPDGHRGDDWPPREPNDQCGGI